MRRPLIGRWVVAGTGLDGFDSARPTHDITITSEPGALLRRRPR